MKRIFSPRRGRGGFSLAEMLVTVAILAILSSLAALGISRALWERSRSIALADAQTVASTAAQLITDELRYGRIVGAEDGGGTMVLASGVYQTPIRLSLDGGGYLTVRSVDGHMEYAPLSRDAYCGLHLSELTFSVDQSGQSVRSVTVELAVSSAEDEELWRLEFTAAPMNERIYTL